MSCIFRLFRREPPIVIVYPPIKDYKGAGCFFHDDKHCLAGYQPRKKSPLISGIGGNKERNEVYVYTAFRELIEELFEPRIPIPGELINLLGNKIKYHNVHVTKGYVILDYGFDDLVKILKLCKQFGLKTPLYKTFPLTLHQVIHDRIPIHSSEISHFALIPMILYRDASTIVQKDFIRDIRSIVQKHASPKELEESQEDK